MVADLGGGGVVVFLWRDLVVVVGFRGWKWRLLVWWSFGDYGEVGGDGGGRR